MFKHPDTKEFAESIAALCSDHLEKVGIDSDAGLAEMITILLGSLAFTLAIVSKGDQEGLNKLIETARSSIEIMTKEKADDGARAAMVMALATALKKYKNELDSKKEPNVSPNAPSTGTVN